MSWRQARSRVERWFRSGNWLQPFRILLKTSRCHRREVSSDSKSDALSN
jgi:hypothetical protein